MKFKKETKKEIKLPEPKLLKVWKDYRLVETYRPITADLNGVVLDYTSVLVIEKAVKNSLGEVIFITDMTESVINPEIVYAAGYSGLRNTRENVFFNILREEYVKTCKCQDCE